MYYNILQTAYGRKHNGVEQLINTLYYVILSKKAISTRLKPWKQSLLVEKLAE